MKWNTTDSSKNKITDLQTNVRRISIRISRWTVQGTVAVSSVKLQEKNRTEIREQMGDIGENAQQTEDLTSWNRESLIHCLDEEASIFRILYYNVSCF